MENETNKKVLKISECYKALINEPFANYLADNLDTNMWFEIQEKVKEYMFKNVLITEKQKEHIYKLFADTHKFDSHELLEHALRCRVRMIMNSNWDSEIDSLTIDDANALIELLNDEYWDIANDVEVLMPNN